MVILTSEQMRRVDERTEREHGIPARTLMDNAGREIAAFLQRRRPDLASRRILILCGRGNNGGDGITAARHLAAAGVVAETVLLGAAADLKGAAEWAYRTARAEGVPVTEIVEEPSWTSLRRRLPEYDLILDALLGTGSRGAATGRIREAIEAVNGAGSEVVSVDVPSGLSGSESAVPGPCVEADATIALAALKIPHAFPPAARFAGAIEVADIGIPSAAIAAEAPDLHWADAGLIGHHLRRRDPETHKGDYGHLLIVAGSRGKCGAAILMARAALRSGAGLVTVATPASAQPVVAGGAPEAMTEPMPETPDGALARGAVTLLRDLLRARDALAIGPGLGTTQATSEAVLEFLADASKPALLDADALNILATAPAAPRLAGPAILTPHPGEAGRLLGITTPEVQADRLAAARRLAEKFGVVALLKGHRTLVADPSREVHVNPTGNPGMATGGAGDVLAGVAGAWLAQGLAPLDAATLAAHAHGLAGDLAAADIGEIGLTAGDLVAYLPRAWRALAAGAGARR